MSGLPGAPEEAARPQELTCEGLEPARAERARARVDAVLASGFANYHDDPCFAGYDPSWGFLAEKLLLEHFNGALKIHLTAPRPGDAPEVLGRKLLFDRHWKDWKSCQRIAATKTEKTAFHLLEKKPDAMLYLLREIPRAELSLHVAAYQAYVWNEVLRRLVREAAGSELSAHPGKAGEYVFAERIDPRAADELAGLRIPLLSEKARHFDERARRHYEAVLAERGVEERKLGRVKVRQAVFGHGSRQAWARSSELTLECLPDGAASGRVKLVLRCVLPRGSDASMLLKVLLADRPA